MATREVCNWSPMPWRGSKSGRCPLSGRSTQCVPSPAQAGNGTAGVASRSGTGVTDATMALPVGDGVKVAADTAVAVPVVEPVAVEVGDAVGVAVGVGVAGAVGVVVSDRAVAPADGVRAGGRIPLAGVTDATVAVGVATTCPAAEGVAGAIPSALESTTVITTRRRPHRPTGPAISCPSRGTRPSRAHAVILARLTPSAAR